MGDPQQQPLPPDHFLAQLGIDFEFDAAGARGSFEVRPKTFAPGTTTIRTALLFTIHDVLAGYMSGEAAGPTLDQRFVMTGRPPAAGRMHLEVKPLRVGKRIMVGEGRFTDDHGVEFARGSATYMHLEANSRSDFSSPVLMAEASFDELLALRPIDERSVALTPTTRLVNNNPAAAVQGGVQALVAELCAQHALGGGRLMTATDIEARFLSALRTPPIVATAETLLVDERGGTCRVVLLDAGERTATYAVVSMRFLD
ncbi:MAG: hypothetical protein AB7L13_15930 [Acidimicrobiia bacterium]